MTGKVADYLAENIEELGIQEDTITNGDRIELLTRVKNQLVRHIQHFIRYHIEHGVQGDVYAEMSHIHGLVGRYDTNSTEGIKAPEWIFLALAVMYGSVAFYLPEDHP